MLVRVAPEIRRAIERSAERKGTSLSAEAEDILVDVIRARKWGDARSRALSYLPGQVCMALKNVYRLDRREFNWRMSPADHEALRAALLHPARPPGASG